MTQAIVDPEQLLRCAAQLEQSAQNMRSQQGAAMVGFASLSDVWRDQKFHTFEKSFTEMLHVLTQYLNEAQGEADYLRAKAAAAQRYLES